jgi:hypothetical protein
MESKGSPLVMINDLHTLDVNIALIEEEISRKKANLKEKNAEHDKWSGLEQKAAQHLEQVRKSTIEKKRLIEDWETKETALTFKLEQARSRDLGKLWILMMSSLVILMFYAYGKQNYIVTLFNGVSFLANWRMLYIRDSPNAVLLAIITIAVSVMFL